MKNKQLFLLLFCCLAIAACKDSLRSDLTNGRNPSSLRYISITDLREGQGRKSAPPTVQTGGLVPEFEIVSIKNSDGIALDNSYLQYVSIGTSRTVTMPVNNPGNMVDGDGNPITSVETVNSTDNGIITIAAGHNFPIGDYYFTIKATTEYEDEKYSTVFDDVFHLRIVPLLPTNLVYSPKNQNLVYGNPDSKTSTPLMPNANPDVYFELANHNDKLIIDRATGVISLAPNYVYTERETLNPTVKVISNISGEVVEFANKLTTVITDQPEQMPVETIYFFYPTLYTSGAFPTGGEGFTIQTPLAGSSTRIWGVANNSVGMFLNAPEERPQGNTAQTVLQATTNNGSSTIPVNLWMVTATQDLTPFQYGYELSFNYYYQPAYQNYLADGRTPTDLEVYISTDYTGGNIQDANGNWLNGTWTKVNAQIKCQRSEGVSGNNSIGAPWGLEFIGTPYPGPQTGADPDGRKTPGTTFYNKWVKCAYSIAPDQISSTFTVAFKVACYFEGEVILNGTPPGRGGTYFLSDFYYKAVEPN